MYLHSRLVRLALLCGALPVGAGMFAGCAQVYDVKVDAMQNREVQPGHSYRIVAKDAGKSKSDVVEQRAVGMVRKALAGHGMYEAENPEDAEVVVEVDYDVGPRRVMVESSEPDIGMPRGPTYGTRDALGRPVLVTVPEPTRVSARDVYEKRLTLVAREAKRSADGKERPPRELWRVEVRVDDEKDKVDEVLPVLVGAAVDHIGTDSTTQQTKRISDKSEPVNFVKGGS